MSTGAYRPSRTRRSRPRVLFACLLLALAGASPARAAKWVAGCPKAKERLWPVGKGGRSASPYFEHVGHEATYRLTSTEVARTGGFSTEPDGNTVEITFTPIDGDPIPLPPFTATAVSRSTLR